MLRNGDWLAAGLAEGIGTTAQFGGASGDAFSAICGMQIPRFTASKPSEFAFASDEKSIRQPTTSFVRCYLNFNSRLIFRTGGVNSFQRAKKTNEVCGRPPEAFGAELLSAHC